MCLEALRGRAKKKSYLLHVSCSIVSHFYCCTCAAPKIWSFIIIFMHSQKHVWLSADPPNTWQMTQPSFPSLREYAIIGLNSVVFLRLIRPLWIAGEKPQHQSQRFACKEVVMWATAHLPSCMWVDFHCINSVQDIIKHCPVQVNPFSICRQIYIVIAYSEITTINLQIYNSYIFSIFSMSFLQISPINFSLPFLWWQKLAQTQFFCAAETLQ